MSVEANVRCQSLLAAGDLSADQYKFVVINSSKQVAKNTVAGGRVDGVLYQPAAAANRAVAFATSGRVKVLLGATLAPGDLVMSSNAGLAVTATSTNFVVGRVVDGGASGEVGTIELIVPGTQLALA